MSMETDSGFFGKRTKRGDSEIEGVFRGMEHAPLL